MNLNKLLFSALFCATSALAQFDNLMGPAYNPYGTLGAAPTIADLIAKPSDIYGHKFIYIAPIDYAGYSAFDLAGGSTFLGFDHSLTLGYAKSSWGLALNLALDKLWYSYDERYYVFEDREVFAGDNIGLNVSLDFKRFIIYAHANWLTNEGYRGITEKESSTKNISLGVAGGSKLVWDVALNFTRTGTMEEFKRQVSDDVVYIYPVFDTLTSIGTQFNLGYKALQNDKAKFIVGLNNNFKWHFKERESMRLLLWRGEVEKDSDYALSLYICPNILGEVILTKHLLAFAGAEHTISFLDGKGYWEKYELRIRNLETTDSYFGLRYKGESWALEARLQKNVWQALDGKDPFINLGGFIYF